MTSFFNEFSQRICEEKNLVDVAGRGVAQQSSVSNWSHKNDAQRAVSRIGKADFAFHTDREDQPWWRLDFKRTDYPEVLCIENREKDAFWDCASKIKVKISADGEAWTTLHEGTVFFGSFAKGIPLILPLDERIPVRHVLIENDQPGYFHIKSVRVLAQESISYDQSIPVFMADRKDGFGERLKAIVNGLALSEYYKGEFRFSWKMLSNSISAAHAIGPPEDTFSDEFLTNYLSSSIPNVGLKDFLRNLKDAPSALPTIVSVPQSALYKIDRAFEKKISSDMFTAAFWKIGFSEPLTRAINLAQKVDIHKEAVGLHLRAGDIIFGRFRFNARYLNKVVPYPIAVEFIKRQKELGKSVILFGQDEALCRNLAQKYDVVFAADYHDKNGFNTLQAAMFDIVLMSRCETVIAGNSGFSHIAQVIGQFQMRDPGEVYSAQETINLIMEALRLEKTEVEVHDYQKSFAYSYAVNNLSNVVSVEDAVTLMEHACAIDEENAFYVLLLAVAYFKAGDVVSCEQVLQIGVEKDYPKPNHGSLGNVIVTQHPDGSFEFDKHAQCLAGMSDQGIVPATGILALFHKAKGNDDYAQTYRDTFLNSCPEGQLPRFSKTIERIT